MDRPQSIVTRNARRQFLLHFTLPSGEVDSRHAAQSHPPVKACETASPTAPTGQSFHERFGLGARTNTIRAKAFLGPSSRMFWFSILRQNRGSCAMAVQRHKARCYRRLPRISLPDCQALRSVIMRTP